VTYSPQRTSFDDLDERIDRRIALYDSQRRAELAEYQLRRTKRAVVAFIGLLYLGLGVFIAITALD
jgi:hypothetical protein